MKKMKTRILGLLAGLCVLACGPRKTAAPAEVAFPSRLDIPSVYSDPAERAAFVASHYWDAFLALDGACDTARLHGVRREEVEHAYGTWVTLLEQACILDDASAAVAKLFKKSQADTAVLSALDGWADKYLYDPNSPVRNEDLYLPWVRARAASPLRQAADDYTIKMCSLNRIGTPAADFPFTDLKGRIRTLYGVKADFTVLFFSNPGCPACHDIVERIRALPNVEKAIEEGRLAVVNVYIDQEVAKWLELSGEYPRSWICGYDHNYLIRSDVLYNVRAIPSLYLLDADKKVLLKDTPQENVLGFIRGL